MRILHAIATLDPPYGGPVVGLVRPRVQARAGLDVSVIATWAAGEDTSLAERLRAEGMKVTLVGPVRGALRRHPDLRDAMRDAVRGTDVVHAHGVWEEIQHQAAVAARAAGKPYVVTPHGMLDPWSLRQKAWKKRPYLAWRGRRDLRTAAAMHFTTTAERDLVAPLGLGVPPLVETPGLDFREFSEGPPPGTFRAKFPAIGDRPIVLFLGRIHPKKGLADLLVPAFARADVKDAVLVIAGPDADGHRFAVEAAVAAAGIGERVIFTGMLADADRIAALTDAALFVLPSYQENFGLAVVESLAAGTPVVVSDQVNIHDQVARAQVGAVVPTQVEPLAHELRRWLGDHNLLKATSDRATIFVRQEYDWDVIARRWVGHYERIGKDRVPRK